MLVGTIEIRQTRRWSDLTRLAIARAYDSFHSGVGGGGWAVRALCEECTPTRERLECQIEPVLVGWN